MKAPNIQKAVEYYLTQTEIGTAEICDIFTCSAAHAAKLKRMARALMQERGVLVLSESSVDVDCAYEAWGWDIKELMRKYERMQRLQGKQRSVFEERRDGNVHCAGVV